MQKVQAACNAYSEQTNAKMKMPLATAGEGARTIARVRHDLCIYFIITITREC